MGLMSRNKGARGEREFARELSRLLGVRAHRGRQYCGGPDSPDVVVDLPEVHFEVKRVEQFRLYPALEQADEDAGSKIPIVAHRKNLKPWVVCLRLDDLPRLASILTEANANTSTVPTESD